MKKAMALLMVLVLCLSCSAGSAGMRKEVVRDMYYLGAMRVVNCRDCVSLRATPDKTGTVHALKDMTDDYVANVLKYLKKCADNAMARYQRKAGYDYGRQERDNLFRDWDDDCDESYWPQEYL